MGSTRIKEKIKYLSKEDKQPPIALEIKQDIKDIRKQIKSKVVGLTDEDFEKLNNEINNLLVQLRRTRQQSKDLKL